MKPSKRLLIGSIGILIWLLGTTAMLFSGTEILLVALKTFGFLVWVAVLTFIITWVITGFEE